MLRQSTIVGSYSLIPTSGRASTQADKHVGRATQLMVASQPVSETTGLGLLLNTMPAVNIDNRPSVERLSSAPCNSLGVISLRRPIDVYDIIANP